MDQRPAFWRDIVDKAVVHQDRRLIDVLDRAAGARTAVLVITIPAAHDK